LGVAVGHTSRRQFLKQAAALAAPALVPSAVLGGPGRDAPSERVIVGSIGVGGRGRLNTRGLMAHGAQVVAVCDVNAGHRAHARREVEAHYAKAKRGGSYRGCAAYKHFQELLGRDDIDAVMIATPDHWHVPIALAAVRAGKAIYVEKPLGISIAEGQALREAVQRSRAVFQHGTEQRSFGRFRRACELVRNGYLGQVKLIRVACPGGRRTGVHPPQPVPKGFDWDLWLGPAAYVPYTPARARAGSWYFISDYAASGFVAGWGVHHVDMAQWALDADHSGPVEIEGRGVLPEDGLYDTPVTWSIDYTYANGVRVNFTDNGQNPQGVVFEGTEGKLHVTRGAIRAWPDSLLKIKLRPDDVHLYRCRSDDANFLECVKSRRETCSPIHAAHRSTSVCYLGHIAILLGPRLRWDPVRERFVNIPEANRLLSRPHRAAWQI
jgi:predicted dehydrogenase